MTSLGSVTVVSRQSESAWRSAQVLRHGWYEFLAANPPMLIISATGPRVLLQTMFYTLLGDAVADPGQRAFAFVGALVIALAGTNAVYVSNIPVADSEYATFWRIRSGRSGPAPVLLLRSAPYPLMGLGLTVAAGAIVGPLVGESALTVRLLPWLPILALIALTSTVAGLAAAALAIGRHADVLVSNLLSYLIVLCSGGFLPPGRLSWVDDIGRFLPATHGLAAIRAGLAHRPWTGELVLEVSVGLGWTALAILTIAAQDLKARKTGHDDYS